MEAAVFNHFRRGVIKKLKHSNSKSKNAADPRQIVDKNCSTSTSVNFSDKYRNRDLRSRKTSAEKTLDEKDIEEESVVSNLNDSSVSLTIVNASEREKSENFAKQSVSLTLNKTDHSAESSPPNRSSLPVFNIEPRIDFELDVKIFFNSGKCVLHTKDPLKNINDGLRMKNYSATEMDDQITQFSLKPNGTNSKESSSLASQKQSFYKTRSSNRLQKSSNQGLNRRDYTQSVGMNPDFTVFLIPGLDIKLNYSSKNDNAQNEEKRKEITPNFRNISLASQDQNVSFAASSTTASTMSQKSQKSSKKAMLFAWITLSSIPDEIFISPHLLDFFEEALKPIPLNLSGQNSATATLSSVQSQHFLAQMSNQLFEESSPSQNIYNYSSFPVDVIIFFHFQPTIIRLGCLPISRVECLLHLPSIDLVMSSNRLEIESDLNSSSSIQQISNKTLKNIKMVS